MAGSPARALRALCRLRYSCSCCSRLAALWPRCWPRCLCAEATVTGTALVLWAEAVLAGGAAAYLGALLPLPERCFPAPPPKGAAAACLGGWRGLKRRSFRHLWSPGKRWPRHVVRPHCLHSTNARPPAPPVCWQPLALHLSRLPRLCLRFDAGPALLSWGMRRQLCDSAVRCCRQNRCPHALHWKGKKSRWRQSFSAQWAPTSSKC